MKKSFRDTVYEITKQIPKGKVATYGQIAAMAGSPRAARPVGMLMKNNPDMPRTPCHRVVASDGRLTGYSAKEGLPAEASAKEGIKTKREMLVDEGVVFSGERVNLVESQWKA